MVWFTSAFTSSKKINVVVSQIPPSASSSSPCDVCLLLAFPSTAEEMKSLVVMWLGKCLELVLATTLASKETNKRMRNLSVYSSCTALCSFFSWGIKKSVQQSFCLLVWWPSGHLRWIYVKKRHTKFAQRNIWSEWPFLFAVWSLLPAEGTECNNQ